MHVRIFGCKAFTHILHEKRQKLNAKTIECTHIGYSEHKQAYILLHKPSGHIFGSRDVHFDEGDGAGAERVVIEADFTEKEDEMSEKAPESKDDSTSDEAEVQDLLDDESDDGDDGDGPPDAGDEEPKHGLGGKPSNSSTSTSNGHSGSASDPSIKQSSPIASVTPKAPGTPPTSSQASRTAPNPPNQPDPPEVHCSGRTRKVPACDNDDHYFVTSYGCRNCPGGRVHIGEERGMSERGGDEIPESDDNVTPVTDETAKAMKVSDPLSYDDAMSWPDAAE